MLCRSKWRNEKTKKHVQTVIDPINKTKQKSKNKIVKEGKDSKEAKEAKEAITRSKEVANAMWTALRAKTVYIQFTADLLLHRNNNVSHNFERCLHYLRI